MGSENSAGPARPFPADRRILITGASSGIGAATARAAAAAGYRVALLARRRDALERLAAELPAPAAPGLARRAATDNRNGPGPSGHLILEADVGDEQTLAQAFDMLEESFGGLDLLVNNAGIGYRARIEELDAPHARRVLDTNVIGPLLVARAGLPLLRRGQLPVLVNVSSVLGRRGVPGQAVYGASKAALSSIGEALRLEWAPDGIAVCNLEPALTATGFFEAQANPAGLPHPDFAASDSADAVARIILQLDACPRPETSLRRKWRLLAALGLFAPRLADRLLAKNLGGAWRAPAR
ncbi:MAG: SDR family NAD(P)-dependent oxidoreductase [Planctomycetota bacterium]|nr:short-chain dehydrogenase [Planctomycetota bacterium]MDP6369686.1 SDR family NAD(P)-dependent oxidoreductase [Planctomycetota bacterium]MDP6954469.1 SDR family NAD(P)-dependent oxidoreductase [Planctomycetota bacterium]